MMPLSSVFFAIIVIALVTFMTRLFPFLFFSKNNPPKIISFIEKYIPPMIMLILVIYCLKDINLRVFPFGLNEAISVLFVVAVHKWKNNPLISIFGGTILYMFLRQSNLFQLIIR